MDQRFILVTLLVKLGVVAAVASALARSPRFKNLLFTEDRNLTQKLQLAMFLAVPVALGVVVRIGVRNFVAADVSFEIALLMGVIGGRFVGGLGGVLLSVPAVAVGSWIWLPFNFVTGLLAGVLRDMAPNREEIWSFSPFIDLSVYRWLKKNIRRPRLDWQISFFLLIVALTFLRAQVAHLFPGPLNPLESARWAIELAAYATTVVAVAVPLKIWNNTRIEIKLEQQERLLLQARMEALQSQINPHFLFNTLNSVSSLIRVDPDRARDVVVKLASILRRLLRSHEAFATLREEVHFIDDYLDIEVVRFGRDKLRVIKEFDPATLDAMIPTMLLQPLVENSIKHGLAPKIDGGSITLRSSFTEDGALVIDVEDDGVGIAHKPHLTAHMPSSGIGLANVGGRLKVLYGDGARVSVSSRPEGGTLVRIRVPVLYTEEIAEAAAGAARTAARAPLV